MGSVTSKPIMFTTTAKRVARRVREYIYSGWKISVRVATQKPFLATDPYRPMVGATLLDDTPFVIKGSEKFPAEIEGEAT